MQLTNYITWMLTFIIFLADYFSNSDYGVNGLVIYRRRPKPKLAGKLSSWPKLIWYFCVSTVVRFVFALSWSISTIHYAKPKVCHEEYVDDEIVQPSSSLLGSITSSVVDESVTRNRSSQESSNRKYDTENKHGSNNKLNRVQKRDVTSSGDSTITSIGIPTTTPDETSSGAEKTPSFEPIIRLGAIDESANLELDEERGGFEIVGENLTDAEKALIRRKLSQTCHALNLN